MPVCPSCETDHDLDALVRHERRSFVVVHCPDCECVLGRYNEHTHRAE